mmetsp:Transcript_30069/g.80245  ORF Transcript_30069/g.80245 Transcript_30069/m.80245 type:complete len:237 (-) Transcript_30069:135-845(-)
MRRFTIPSFWSPPWGHTSCGTTMPFKLLSLVSTWTMTARYSSRSSPRSSAVVSVASPHRTFSGQLSMWMETPSTWSSFVASSYHLIPQPTRMTMRRVKRNFLDPLKWGGCNRLGEPWQKQGNRTIVCGSFRYSAKTVGIPTAVLLSGRRLVSAREALCQWATRSKWHTDFVLRVALRRHRWPDERAQMWSVNAFHATRCRSMRHHLEVILECTGTPLPGCLCRRITRDQDRWRSWC